MKYRIKQFKCPPGLDRINHEMPDLSSVKTKLDDKNPDYKPPTSMRSKQNKLLQLQTCFLSSGALYEPMCHLKPNTPWMTKIPTTSHQLLCGQNKTNCKRVS